VRLGMVRQVWRMRSVTVWWGFLGRQGMVECGVVVKDMVRQAWYGRVRLGEVGCGRLGKVRFGLISCGLLGQARCGVMNLGVVGYGEAGKAWLVWWDAVRTGRVRFGRLGEVGLVVVWKVLSGRLGLMSFGEVILGR
jgi:hypothetical protein